MAKKIGLSHMSVWRLETGKTKKVTQSVLEKVSQNLDIPAEVLAAVAGEISLAVNKHNSSQDQAVKLLQEIKDELRKQTQLLSKVS